MMFKQNKREGIAPLIAALIILAVTAVAGVTAYELTVKPDVSYTYNISNPESGLGGITIGGNGINLTWVVLGVIVIVGLYVLVRAFVRPRERRDRD